MLRYFQNTTTHAKIIQLLYLSSVGTLALTKKTELLTDRRNDGKDHNIKRLFGRISRKNEGDRHLLLRSDTERIVNTNKTSN